MRVCLARDDHRAREKFETRSTASVSCAAVAAAAALAEERLTHRGNPIRPPIRKDADTVSEEVIKWRT